MTDRDRIARQMEDPALLRLHRALSRLESVVTVMNTGAHPDDEQNGLLAFLRLGLGMRVVVACSTRGEGGQNILGPERGAALGVLRTREMEAAAARIDADVVWLGFGPGDPVHDFGFSKTGEGTLARWGEERLLERLVRAYRSECPDIVIPTFLDVPGQHGHHRAMTRAARQAIALAADPAAFPDHLAEGLQPWQVAKFYLPAWSGGGATYDDELPPPKATLRVQAAGRDPATGAAWDHIGEWSRYYHASQAMGQWRDVPRDGWDLHLEGGAPEAAITEDLPASLGDLAALPGAPPALSVAADAIGAAIAAFPAADRILPALLQADRALQEAEADSAYPHRHRVTRKRIEVQAALFEAAGVTIRAWPEPALLPAGGQGRIGWHVAGDRPVTLRAVLPDGVTGGEAGPTGLTVTAAPDAPFSQPFRPGWEARGGNHGTFLSAEMVLEDRTIRRRVDLDEPLQIVPARTLQVEPDAFVLRLADPPAALDLRFRGPVPDLSLPPGVTLDGTRLHLTGPIAPGLHDLAPRLDGRPAMRMTTAAYPHVGRLAYLEPAALRLLALDLALPDARIGYVGGGGDRVGLWLGRMGLDVTVLDDLAADADLSRFDTIVIGIVAFGTRPDLAAAVPALHRFVQDGGHLVTLYQRPDQGWTEGVPPRPLTIGTPSLRWRVTDPAAPVTVLAPDHPLLSGPNRIGPEDWAGWDKERGIYFAARWDAAYQPLLAMSDAGEAPLQGALVSGAIGAGRHTHTSLVLHHQLDRLVPGAFRLLANLVQPAW
ncbi:PIG-L family deacetylase [Plastorhodobacter daqingensis]|uniref:PIG-L family deacetylase n=1 Tax=Plastorhodobacter daqingensis TaxID=1387281 RepID=A0ABW2UM02_9RHOB